MADDEKDRYGDKLRDSEKAKEDQFFAERERKLLDKLKAPRTAPPAEPPASAGGTKRDDGDRETSAGREPFGWLARLLGRSR